MILFNLVRRFASRQLRQYRYQREFERFSEFTMIPRDAYVANLFLAERVLGLPGCVVECGVWRGGMIAGLGSILGAGREYYLFDSFEGLPPAKEIDGKAALNWQQEKNSPIYYDNCAASQDFAQRAMTIAGIESFHLVKGWFNETLPGFTPAEPIALLRLDGDWYDSTMVCLESLFDYVVPGGLILIDDYYAWDGCAKAVHDFLSRRSATERIRNHGQICYLQKTALNA